MTDHIVGSDTMVRCLGQWNARVLQGADKEARRALLEEVPEPWRAAVADHVRTYFAVKAHRRLAR